MHGEEFVVSANSYLGQMKHFATYNIRNGGGLEGGIAPKWWKVMYVSGHLKKIVLKNNIPHVPVCNGKCNGKS